jgi:hypothetical protein
MGNEFNGQFPVGQLGNEQNLDELLINIVNFVERKWCLNVTK